MVVDASRAGPIPAGCTDTDRDFVRKTAEGSTQICLHSEQCLNQRVDQGDGAIARRAG